LHLHGHVAEAIQKRNPGEARKFMERIVKQAADDISTVLAINVAQFADLSEGRSSSLGRLGKNPFAPPALRGLRRLGRKELEERRLQAVHLVESGQSPESVARHLGLNRTTVYDWLAHYRSRGEAGLTSRPIPGRPKKLTVRQLHSLRENLSKAPRDFGFKEPLWNLAAVRDLIRREFDVPLSSGSVRRLLAELGLDCKRPLKEILERDPVRSRSWLKSEYPRLKALCRDQGAELFFEKPLAGTSPDGGKPMQAREEIRDTPSRFFCAVTSKGTAQFIGLTDTLTPVQYLSFLTAFTTGLRGLAYLVASPGALHEDAQVLSFLERNEERVRLIALPV
jgi:transposase